MKVLMQIRPDFLQMIAGDTVQLLQTRTALIKQGIQVDISTTYDSPLAKYDLIHLFNTTRVQETYNFFTRAKAQKKPVAVSTIYWNAKEFFNNHGQTGEIAGWDAANDMRREIFSKADILLPNAQKEMDMISSDFAVSAPYHIVPNGADINFSKADAQYFIKNWVLADFILCVGRICTRKNQLNLVQAAHKLGLPVVLIGPVNEHDYLKKCTRYKNVTILPPMKPEHLAAAYHAAKVHVLPSWFETPGLASLEAALCGCNIVTTDRGTAKEYFGDMAFYCAPDRPETISQAIMTAYNKKKDNLLVKHITKNFTWDIAAQETLKAYQIIL